MDLKITDRIKKIIPEHLSILDLFLYAAVLTICYLLFQHGDLFHTSSSSYAYLNGHITDFYDFNDRLIPGDYYLPTIYIFFAIWNIPLKLLGLLHDIAAGGLTLSVVELTWTKFLLVIFYFATTYVIYLIGKVVSSQSQKAKTIAVIFATSPIAIFVVFIFGQYDIIGIFFTMLGFYYYLKHDYYKFSIFFSIAISVKYFPLILFIPLILLAEKRIVHIIKYGAISLAVTLLEIAFYYPNVVFRNNFLTLASGKTTALAEFNLSPLNSSPYLIILFAIICIYAYIKEIDQDVEHHKTAIFISLTAYSVTFLTITWHPQWLIMIMPFFALAYLFVRDASKSYMLDMVGMFSYIFLVVDFFPHNVDANMLGSGILRSFFSYIPLSNSQLFLPQFSHIFMGLFFVYLISPLLVQLFQKVSHTRQALDEPFNPSNACLRSRFYIGVAIFVIPSLFCALAPRNIARRIDPNAYTIAGLSITQSNQLVGPINQNGSIKQSFVAENDNLFRVNVKLATYARKNNCHVTLTLLDEANLPIATQKMDGETMTDNTFYKFKFKSIEHSKGKLYSIEIKSDGTVENSISAWKSNADVYLPGKLYLNGKVDTGDLNIELFYN